MNNVVNEAANPPTLGMQQLLIERANMRRKSAATSAMRNSSSDWPVVSRSSRASSPAAAVMLPFSPSSMQQERANMRRSLQANMTSTEDPLLDAAARRSVERLGPDHEHAFTSPSRNSSADKRRSSPDQNYQDQTQMMFSIIRENFLQELAVTGARGSASASNYGVHEEGGHESSTNEKEKKREKLGCCGCLSYTQQWKSTGSVGSPY